MSGRSAAAVEVRRSGSRFRTVESGIRTWHSFSFGRHYDPANTGFGLLLAHNDEEVAAGAGYAEHRHRDVEVVTWVVNGVLRHRHGDGAERLLGPASVQRLHAGSGVVHAESETGGRPLRFVQAWLPSARPEAAPSYECRDLAAALTSGGSVVAASGLGRDVGGPGIRLVHPGAALHVVRPVGRVRLPAAPFLHVYVVSGRVALDGAGELGAGDAARISGGPVTGGQVTGGQVTGGQVTGDLAPVLHPAGVAEVLVWEMSPGG